MANRILLVDNYPNVAGLVGQWLEARGNDVRIARDAFQTLRLAEDFRPDLILIDIDVAVIKAREVVRHIRRRRWGKEPAIIAQTGWPDPKIAPALFDGVLPRPIDYDELSELLISLDNMSVRRSASVRSLSLSVHE